MSAVEGLPAPMWSVKPDDRRHLADTTLPALCPYLATPDGSWRSASAVREHRCTAVAPPIPLALDKQRRLCLVAAHTSCATYGAAQAARPQARNDSVLRPIARMTPVILDHGRFDVRIPALRADHVSGQALLVGVLGIALTAILISRPSGDGGAAGAAGTSGAVGSATPLASEPAPTEFVAGSPTAGTSDPTEAAPTDEPVSTPAPTAAPSTSGATYKVKSGDTLSAIAARFGTTVRVLVDLNGISDPSRLRIGQVLKLP